MTRWARLLTGLGFSWVTLFGVVGALLGTARVDGELHASPYVFSWQRELLRSLHAHMNGFGILLILAGLSFGEVCRMASERTARRLSLLLLAGIPTLGLGLFLESLAPPSPEGFPTGQCLSALGGSALLISLGAWGAIFLRGAQR